MANSKRAANMVTAVFDQNLTSTNKAGEIVEFHSGVQAFSTETLTELTSEKVGLWLIGVLKHFIRLQRLQGRTGFKMSKPVDLKLSVNNKTENLSFKFTLSISRIKNLLDRYPAMVTEAFLPSPAIGTINKAAIERYFVNAETIVLAPAIKKAELSDIEEVKELTEGSNPAEIKMPLIEA